MSGEDMLIHSDEWFQTFTGKRFFLGNPRAEDVCIEDIAHALAGVIRYGGMSRSSGMHGNRYTVAEHSLLLARYTRDVLKRDHNDVRAALLHDAAAAYTGDIKRPIKNAFPIIREAVKRVEGIVAAKFCCPAEKPAWLAEIDDRIVADEKKKLMGRPVDGTLWSHEQRGVEGLGVVIQCWHPVFLEKEFLYWYRKFC